MKEFTTEEQLAIANVTIAILKKRLSSKAILYGYAQINNRGNGKTETIFIPVDNYLSCYMDNCLEMIELYKLV